MIFHKKSIVFALTLWIQSYVCITLSQRGSNPNVVDLGYARHNVSFSNTTAGGHTINVYKNIRFAKPPTRSTRFQKPQTPPAYDGEVRDGLYNFDTRCVSAVPQGVEILYPGLNGTTFGSEDCLFLDVYVPDGLDRSKPVPVLHWIYGSGYAFGAKDFAFTPFGLLDLMAENKQPFILVASNYRMGLYGWMSSPHEDMTPNLGLWDSLTALEWTQKYIDKFGGNSSQITAIGQSAGSGIIETLVTSPKLSNCLPFQQAFLSSPALPLKRNVTQRRQDVYEAVLNATNCMSLECLTELDEKALAQANLYLEIDVRSLSGGGTTGPGIGFTPVVDGDLIYDRPEALPNLGQVAHGLHRLVTSNMDSEGEIVSSDENMPQAFPGLVRRIIPSASNATVAAIQSSYQYPADQPKQLAWQWTADAVFMCHALALSEALPNRTRRYVMTIPPAWHGQDQLYFFFTDNKTTPVVDINIAKEFQRRLGEFIYGEDTALDKDWPVHGSDGTFLNITESAFEVELMDTRQIDRCKLINKIFSDPANGI